MRKITFLFLINLLLACGTSNNEQKVTEPKIITVAELENKDLDELRIIRNEIFARKGYIFNSEDLKKHFLGFDWYEPRFTNVDSLLTETDKKNIQTILELEKEIKAEHESRTIRISSERLKDYTTYYDSGDKWEKGFMDKMFWTIDKFKNRPADSTILTIGNIDGIEPIDTVINRIYYQADTVYLESNWIRNGELLWTDKIRNPYAGIGNTELFDYDLRHPWVTFTIAIHSATPELTDRTDYSGINRETALKMANWHIERENLGISEQEYESYFDSFKGQLFSYGDPEARNGLFQWYEPKKIFVLYYAP